MALSQTRHPPNGSCLFLPSFSIPHKKERIGILLFASSYNPHKRAPSKTQRTPSRRSHRGSAHPGTRAHAKSASSGLLSHGPGNAGRLLGSLPNIHLLKSPGKQHSYIVPRQLMNYIVIEFYSGYICIYIYTHSHAPMNFIWSMRLKQTEANWIGSGHVQRAVFASYMFLKWMGQQEASHQSDQELIFQGFSHLLNGHFSNN